MECRYYEETYHNMQQFGVRCRVKGSSVSCTKNTKKEIKQNKIQNYDLQKLKIFTAHRSVLRYIKIENIKNEKKIKKRK